MGLIFNIISIKSFKLCQKPMTFIKIKAKDITFIFSLILKIYLRTNLFLKF